MQTKHKSTSTSRKLATRASKGRRYGGRRAKSREGDAREKRGTLRSGSGKKVTSRKQAIAIGLSEARRAGGKVPAKKKRS